VPRPPSRPAPHTLFAFGYLFFYFSKENIIFSFQIKKQQQQLSEINNTPTTTNI